MERIITEAQLKKRFKTIIEGAGPVIPRIAVEAAVHDLIKNGEYHDVACPAAHGAPVCKCGGGQRSA